MNLAAQGDTWGIPGPAFLVLYGTLLVTLVILAAIHRRVLFAGRRGVSVDGLGPQQVAYLNGGAQLAVYAALGGLRAAGAIAGGTDRLLHQAGPMPSGVTALDTAVYNAAGRRIRARDLGRDEWVGAALRQLRDGLEAQGLAVSPGAVRTARFWALAGAAVVLFGVARLVDGVQNGKPVGFLVALVVAGAVASLLLLRKGRRATRAATKAMAGLRIKHHHLAPEESPSYATYGPSDAAMGVALYGGASLYLLDPSFAADAEIQRAGATGGSTTSCGSSGGSSCGGGGGCGGGGCGG